MFTDHQYFIFFKNKFQFNIQFLQIKLCSFILPYISIIKFLSCRLNNQILRKPMQTNQQYIPTHNFGKSSHNKLINNPIFFIFIYYSK